MTGDEDMHNMEIIESGPSKYTVSYDTTGMDEKTARFESEFIAELDEDGNYANIISNYQFVDNTFQYWPYKAASPASAKASSSQVVLDKVKALVCGKSLKKSPTPKKSPSPKTAKASGTKVARCPKGTRKNKKTGLCEPA